MVDFSEGFEGKTCWFVGAAYGGTEDVSDEFIEKGIWQNGYHDKYTDLVKSMKPGDPIAIKSVYTRKKNLPFDNRDQHVSVMGIKAIGKVLKNHGDGKLINVDWEKLKPIKEWYFFTYRNTVWKMTDDSWMSEGLIKFAFKDAPQDIDRFRNYPFWAERYGDNQTDRERFPWTNFYQSIADRILDYRHDRSELVSIIHSLGNTLEGFPKFIDKLEDDSERPLIDICPFTIMGIFTRGMTYENRTRNANALAHALNLDVKAPENFDGVPLLNNQNTWFFGYSKAPQRHNDDIESLWSMFESAIDNASDDSNESQQRFLDNYNNVAGRYNIGWNLSMGLFWIRPWYYLPLDTQSQRYITKKLGLKIEMNGPNGRCSGDDYLSLKLKLEKLFLQESYSAHSFPDLSLQAWRFNPPAENAKLKEGNWRKLVLSKIIEFCNERNSPIYFRQEFKERYLTFFQEQFPENNSCEYTIDANNQVLRDMGILDFLGHGQYEWLGFNTQDESDLKDDLTDIPEINEQFQPYGITDILNDGCFIEETQLKEYLTRLRQKKNIILQGPPGTGKSWLAKRLGFALMGELNEVNLWAVQFHPNLSYEDFVRGYRPSGDGKLELIDGPMVEMINAAKAEPSRDYVLVIEEINRGNPAQIFGEMLTLLEADKRNPNEALKLSYSRGDERVFIPENLYIIGTMNIADRSLAMVDLALRRRFAFINLLPMLNTKWQSWVNEHSKVDNSTLSLIKQRITELNELITDESSLGEQFTIGHSYVTPTKGTVIEDAANWFKQVVKTEIGVLLEEYWYEDLSKARQYRDKLIEGL